MKKMGIRPRNKNILTMKTFKKYILTIVPLLILILSSSFQSTDPDAILGTWKEKDGTKTIEIYKVKTSYFGKITENLSEGENKIKPGTVIMKDFVYNDEEWKGTIEIPTRDMSLKAKITLEGPNEIKAVATIFFIGKAKTWLRAE